MKITFTLTDDEGHTFQGTAKLAPTVRERTPKSPKKAGANKGNTTAGHVTRIDFAKPLRPFIRQYARGISGPKKFTLVLSWLVKGDLKKEVALQNIEKYWNQMKAHSLLGITFNRFYPGEAKDKDWVESKKKSFYNLRPSWKDIFS